MRLRRWWTRLRGRRPLHQPTGRGGGAPGAPPGSAPSHPPAPLRLVGHSLHAHEGQAWAPALEREEAALDYVYDPFVTVRLADFAGHHLNVHDRVRRSWQPDLEPGAPATEIWWFGSGALFGFGQRDDHTIPSCVARLAHGDGVAVRTCNFGVPLLTGWQEALLFARMLAERPPPDVVVFYSGANDIAVSFCAPDPEGLSVIHAPEIEAALLEWGRLHTAPRPVTSPAPAVGDPQVFAEVYGRGVTLARWLGQAVDVPVLHVLQAELNAGRPSAWDVAVYDLLGDPAPDEQWRRRYRGIRALLPEGVVDLRDVLGAIDEPTFFDYTHTNERGARLVAERLYDDVAPLLRAGSRRS